MNVGNEVPSTRSTELVTTNTALVPSVNPLRMRNGVGAPAFVNCSVLIPAPKPCTVRLLMVMVAPLSAPVVVASIVTVLVAALVMKLARCKTDGAPCDQLPPVSHLPVPAIQLLVDGVRIVPLLMNPAWKL